MFTHSANFEFTKTLEAKRPIVINIRSDKSNKISTGVKIGIGIIAGTAVLAIVVAGMLFLIKRNRKIEDFDEETFEINNSASTVFVSQNPLINLLENDDPFEDEFD